MDFPNLPPEIPLEINFREREFRAQLSAIKWGNDAASDTRVKVYPLWVPPVLLDAQMRIVCRPSEGVTVTSMVSLPLEAVKLFEDDSLWIGCRVRDGREFEFYYIDAQDKLTVLGAVVRV
jgi:hypothetical protein